ncbi:uncharacterized protein [Choristoneura fumiferana]|uniref:uncharacterized protein n=1 Tax=Choristoneura fumiferana TaxID=7141 RepID=UPI003D155CF4
MTGYLQPKQVGFGTAQGCEAAIHATRSFVFTGEAAGAVVVKVDIKNAFNSVERDVILKEVLNKVPSLYPFLHQCYHKTSHLYFNGSLVSSQVGAQQGDPLGPLVFCLAIHGIVTDLASPLNVWYLDDGTIGGDPEVVLADLEKLVPALREIGLEINSGKCELYACGALSEGSLESFQSLIPGIKILNKAELNLLGAPIFPEGVTSALEAKRQALVLAQRHLTQLSAHVALTLLRNCFSMPRMVYLLRTAPTWLFEDEVKQLDDTIRGALEGVINVHLDDPQWCQAALPVRCGGLGVRRVHDVGLIAFLASAHGVGDLVARILPCNGGGVPLPFVPEALAVWSLSGAGDRWPVDRARQRQWDDIACERIGGELVSGASVADVARLKAVVRPEAGAWLHALPSPQLGTLLDNDSLRIAVALRLGCKVCERHRCVCGVMVEEDGHHGLSCQRCAGRFSRHHCINGLIGRAMVQANVPCVLEPPGLSRSDGKRPDGLTLVPWQRGRCLLWDATCVSTFAPSHLGCTSRSAGAAAENAARSKHLKYSALEPTYDFVPFAVETAGPWGAEAKSLVWELGRRLRDRGCDPRSGSYLVQQVALAIQRGNAAGIMGTFEPGTTRNGGF